LRTQLSGFTDLPIYRLSSVFRPILVFLSLVRVSISCCCSDFRIF